MIEEKLAPDYTSEYRLIRVFSKFFLGLTVMLVFVHLNPLMPDAGLDYSWMMAMNEAMAQKLTIGKDIVFSSGPYGSVYTRLYHPATDHLMLFGGLILGIGNMLLLLNLSRKRSVIWQLLFTLFIASEIFLQDILLFLYPILFVFFIYQKVSLKDEKGSLDFNSSFAILVSYIPLGLIILIKGSTFTIVTLTVIISAVLFWKTGLKKLAITALLTPFLSALFLLGIAGQPIIGLWHYIQGVLLITSGYSGAMYKHGSTKELIFYLLAAAVMLYMCYSSKETSRKNKYFLCLSLAIYFFTAFKAGFTRHDGHAMIAAGCLVTAAFLLFTILNQKYLYLSFFISCFSWMYITYQYAGSAVLNMFRPLPSFYTESLDGLMARISGDSILQQHYKEKVEAIKNNAKISQLTGTADIYSIDQSYLLASGNKWSPRPALQSYNAYNKKLAELNEAHLTGPAAPDNIIFTVLPIDMHVPSLDDGLSWPTILNNYSLGKNENGFIYLQKKKQVNTSPTRKEVLTKNYVLNEEIEVPDSSQVLFVQLDINETIAGKVITSLYQPEPIEMHFTLVDGTTRKYTLIPGMAKAGFILSPLIENKEEFSSLFSLTLPENLKNKVVRSFKISNDGLGFRKKVKSWKSNFTVHFYKIVYN
jgi:hypothetical protein